MCPLTSLAQVTYMNKGQFYGVTLDYSPDPAVHLKSHTVKSVIMLVFRYGNIHLLHHSLKSLS